jgi:RHS repeat-associated protein
VKYEYNALGRLTKAKGGTNNLWSQTYSYDRFGNRTNVVATGNGINNLPMQKDGTPNLTYDNLSNRITNSGVQYDVAGNQIRALAEDGVTWLKYEYDAANRLQVIKKDVDNSYLQAFQFGSSNQRLMDYDYLSGVFHIMGNGGAVEYTEYASAVMTWTKSYVYLGDSVLSTATPNGSGGETTEFNHPDRLGTKLTTNQQTGTFSEQNSLPFGTALASETTPNNNTKKFSSYERSARTGLDYAINRTYDSKLGRFTQVDLIKMDAASLVAPQTLNLYSYCGNDPINHTDSDGLFWGFFKKFVKWALVALAVVSAIVAIATFNIPAGAGILKSLSLILGLVSSLTQSASTILAAFGYSKVARILGWISLITGAIGNVIGKYATPGKSYDDGWGSKFQDDGWVDANGVYHPPNPNLGTVTISGVLDDLVSIIDRVSPIIQRARFFALQKLRNNRTCREYVLGKIGANVYSDEQLNTIVVKYDPNLNKRYPTANGASRAGGGLSEPILISPLGLRNGGNAVNNYRSLRRTILHEIRHTLLGIKHPKDASGHFIKTGPDSNFGFYKGLRQNCGL